VDNGDGTITFTNTGGGGGSVSWGSIVGTLSNQTDLLTALNLKADISSLSAVATSGDYNDLSNIPTIPAAQVNSDWTSVSGVSEILNKPTLATVATSGDYNDLINTPSIPQNLGDLNDVDTTSAAQDDLLTYDGTQWEPITPKDFGAKLELDNLADVDIINPQTQEVMTYDAVNQVWSNMAAQFPTDVQLLNICTSAYLEHEIEINFANAEEWTRIGSNLAYQTCWTAVAGNSGSIGNWFENGGDITFQNGASNQRCMVWIDLQFTKPANHELEVGISKTIHTTVLDGDIIPQSRRAYHFDSNGAIKGTANFSFIFDLLMGEEFGLYVRNMDDTTKAGIRYANILINSNWY
jgi:hypothetical protein